MKPESQKEHRRRGFGTLRIAASALFFILYLLALYELDRQHYSGAKYEIMRNNFWEILRPPPSLGDNSRAVLLTATQRQRTQAVEELSRQFREILQGPSAIYQFTLVDAHGQVVLQVADPEKMHRLNDFSNNLFFRDFTRMSDQTLSSKTAVGEEQEPIGHLRAYFTSPKGNRQIEELTVRYRYYALALSLIFAAIYYFFYKYLLRPMHVVTSQLELPAKSAPALISRPESRLERSYNRLAAQALLQQLQQQFMPGTGGRSNGAEQAENSLQRALDYARAAFGAIQIQLCELTPRERSFSVIACHASGTEPLSVGEALQLAQEMDARKGTNEETGFHLNAEGQFLFEQAAGQLLVIITGQLDLAQPNLGFRAECMKRACSVMQSGVLATRAREQDIFRQRNEANIVLSRNLGHDLTNIIATTKLDLMVVRQLLSAQPGTITETKRQLLQQSVNGVLESTRFLQEIVNIYRSFSYVKRPQFERYNLAEVVEQLLQSFEKSVSSRIRILRDYQKDMPTLILEPRLLKLALFNVITNALDAMKRDNRADKPPAHVMIRTRFDSHAGEFLVEIEDNGPGIRNSSGQLMDRGELDAIFQYGYSTKTESSEGLGLNWVRTIVEQFHHGSVSAENLPVGGAKFILRLKSMESAEARIGEQSGH
jgi:signal transduction histidine kinase